MVGLRIRTDGSDEHLLGGLSMDDLERMILEQQGENAKLNRALEQAREVIRRQVEEDVNADDKRDLYREAFEAIAEKANDLAHEISVRAAILRGDEVMASDAHKSGWAPDGSRWDLFPYAYCPEKPAGKPFVGVKLHEDEEGARLTEIDAKEARRLASEDRNA